MKRIVYECNLVGSFDSKRITEITEKIESLTGGEGKEFHEEVKNFKLAEYAPEQNVGKSFQNKNPSKRKKKPGRCLRLIRALQEEDEDDPMEEFSERDVLDDPEAMYVCYWFKSDTGMAKNGEVNVIPTSINRVWGSNIFKIVEMLEGEQSSAYERTGLRFLSKNNLEVLVYKISERNVPVQVSQHTRDHYVMQIGCITQKMELVEPAKRTIQAFSANFKDIKLK